MTKPQKPKIESTTSVITWAPSIGTDNLCGFASLVPLVDDIIARPELYYSAAAPRNYFITQYFAALELAEREYVKGSTAAKAAAIKSAFAECVIADKREENPFHKLFSLICIGIVPIVQAQEEVNDSLIKRFLATFLQQFRALYQNFVGKINEESSKIELSNTERLEYRKMQYRDDKAFFEFVNLNAPEASASFNQFISENLDADSAAHTTLIDLTELFKVACTDFLDSQHKDESELYDSIVKAFANTQNEAIQALLESYKAYVNNINLDVNSSEPLFSDRERLKVARYLDTAAFYQYVLTTSPDLVQKFVEFSCNALIDKDNAYPAREVDLCYILSLLGCIKDVSFFKQGKYSTYVLNPEAKYNFRFNNTGFHWEAEALPHFIKPNLAQDQLATRPKDNDLQLALPNSQALLFFFTEAFLQQPKISALCQDPDAELNRIAVAGDKFINNTLEVNDLLDNPATNEADVVNKLKEFTPDLNALLDDPTVSSEHIEKTLKRFTQ